MTLLDTTFAAVKITASESPNVSATSASTDVVYPWIPDTGNGLYRNPILCADYSDPDVVRAGEDFYLTASSFNCTPGLPILHSRDLVNWTLINHAVKNLPGDWYQQVQPGCGIWAPAIRYHAGRFWIFFPMPDDGIFVTTADHPAGEWSEPHCLIEGKGLIDPCPLWDDDGSAYLVHAYARSRSGIKHRLQIRPMAPDGSRLLGEGVIIADGEECFPTIEGPKFLKRDDWYYVLAPAGGVATGWQMVLRSRHIYGPYEARNVLEQGISGVNGPHQGALVDTPSGGWWFIHFQDAGVYGRIVHLQPVEWRDGWPEMGVDRDGNGIGEPVETYPLPIPAEDAVMQVPATTDTFDSLTLGLQWQWYANHAAGWHSLTERAGYLRLYAQPGNSANFSLTPHLLLQKFPARAFTVETAVEFAPSATSDETGLAVVGLRHAVLALKRTRSGNRLSLRIDNELLEEIGIEGDALRLRVTVREGGWCRFAWAAPESGDWTDIGVEFGACEGQWIGAKVGLFASAAPNSAPGRNSYADFAYFRFSPPAAVAHLL